MNSDVAGKLAYYVHQLMCAYPTNQSEQLTSLKYFRKE